MTVIFPLRIARNKLIDAAPVRVNNGVRERVRAEIARVRNAVKVAVKLQDVRGLRDGAILIYEQKKAKVVQKTADIRVGQFQVHCN